MRGPKGNPGNPGRPGKNGDSWDLREIDGTYYWFKNGANTGISAQTAGGTPDHTQAVADHTRAESDHTRAESDHAAVRVYVDSLGVFDISSYHATDGVLAKYADLTAALGTDGENIPADIRRGGMRIQFIKGNAQSSDNKYVQYFLTKDEWSVSEADWQKLNLEEEISQLAQKVEELDEKVNGKEGLDDTFSFQIVPWRNNDDVNIVYDGDVPVGTELTITINELPVDVEIRGKNSNNVYVNVNSVVPAIISAGTTEITVITDIAVSAVKLYSNTNVSGEVSGDIRLEHESFSEKGLIDNVAEMQSAVSANSQNISKLDIDKGISKSQVIKQGEPIRLIIPTNIKSGDAFEAELIGVDVTRSLYVRLYKDNSLVQDFGLQMIGTLKTCVADSEADSVVAELIDTSHLTDDSEIVFAIGGQTYKQITKLSKDSIKTKEDISLLLQSVGREITQTFDVTTTTFNVRIPLDLHEGRSLHIKTTNTGSFNVYLRLYHPDGTFTGVKTDAGLEYSVEWDKEIVLDAPLEYINLVTYNAVADNVITADVIYGISMDVNDMKLEVKGKPFVKDYDFNFATLTTYNANEKVNVLIDGNIPSGSRISVTLNEPAPVDLVLRALQPAGTWYATIGEIAEGSKTAVISMSQTLENYGGLKLYTTSAASNVGGTVTVFNESFGHKNLGERIDEIYNRMARFYRKPCVTLVADDFYYSNNDYAGYGVTTKEQHDAFHDALIAAGLTCDVGASWNQLNLIQKDNPLDVIATAKQWEEDGFQFIFHPIHTNWYEGGAEHKNLADARKQLLDDIVKSRVHLACKQRVFLYPGSSGADSEARAMVREFFDCGVSWDNSGYYSVPIEGDDRYHIKRFNMQIGEQGFLTMAEMKSSIDEAAANNAWIILGMHAHWLDLNGTSTSTEQFTIANMMEIINYALEKTGTTKLVHIEEEWERRKPYYDFIGA